tara:strand:- start:171 stop:446 length:276 start_codon:yes stop_codon:yes gene_type:complete
MEVGDFVVSTNISATYSFSKDFVGEVISVNDERDRVSIVICQGSMQVRNHPLIKGPKYMTIDMNKELFKLLDDGKRYTKRELPKQLRDEEA